MAHGVALYGGSFNPIHVGHLIIARSVREQLGLDRVIFLPSAQPPHKAWDALASAAHRCEMTRLAIAGEVGFEFSDYDAARPGPSFTVDTVSHFRQVLGAGVPLCWIIGADSLAELNTWHRVEVLVDACRIVTAVRSGWRRPDLTPLKPRLTEDQITRLSNDVLDTPCIDISSTDIRRRVREGRSIRYTVPERVMDYIGAVGLYS